LAFSFRFRSANWLSEGLSQKEKSPIVCRRKVLATYVITTRSSGIGDDKNRFRLLLRAFKPSDAINAKKKQTDESTNEKQIRTMPEN